MFKMFKKKPKKGEGGNVEPAVEAVVEPEEVTVVPPQVPASVEAKASLGDQRDIETVISEIAAHKKDEDYQRLYALLFTQDLCVPVDPATLPAHMPSGSKLEANRPSSVRIRTVRGPRGALLIPCATHDEAQMVKDGYVKMTSADYLGLVRKVAPAWGAIIQGKTSWVGFDKKRISAILTQHAGQSLATRH